MTSMSERLRLRYYGHLAHPYKIFEAEVDKALGSGKDKVLLDAGCGRTVPVLRKYLGRASRLVGVELVDFTDVPPGIEAYKANLARIPLPDSSVDVIMSRSVFEHLADPAAVYREFERILRPPGTIIFLTANMWDYGTLVARLIPNRFHSRIVRHAEGRAEEDTFPTVYKTNTRAAIARLARDAGLEVARIDYLSQYPNYLMFNGVLFLIGTAYERLISRFEALRVLRGWLLVVLRKSAP